MSRSDSPQAPPGGWPAQRPQGAQGAHPQGVRPQPGEYDLAGWTQGLGGAPLPNPKPQQPAARWRVTKTYGPTQDGAKRFALRYGEQLVCVRHRLSDDGKRRLTTVELVVETTPVVSRQRTLIAVRIPAHDQNT